MLFSSRSLERVRFQFTHPRGVRPRVKVGNLAHSAVSIHAPARGVTSTSIVLPDPLGHAVSIHAPARGATMRYGATCSRFSRFNSRTREGCDPYDTSTPMVSVTFQFTHPRGVRPLMYLRSVLRCMVSIHAPARGATNGTGSLFLSVDVSIHAPARGATHAVGDDLVDGSVSIHAPTRGATHR